MALQEDQPPRDRIGDWAYAKIRDTILDGELAPGTRLSVPDLAKRLDISRSPVRESILRLLSEGLAEEIPHQGAFVADITVNDLVDLYAVRSVLEGLAARLAADRVTAESHEHLSKAIEAHRNALDEGDRYKVTETDMAFHSLLSDMSDNLWLKDSLMRLQSLVRLGMRATLLVTGSPALALSEHEEIMAAVLARDPDTAETKTHHHVDRLRQTLLTHRM